MKPQVFSPPAGLLQEIAARVGTPYWLYDAATIRRRIAAIREIAEEAGVQPRYAMKACPATRVLREMAAAGIWIDAVSGNEVLRALQAGHPAGQDPPAICFTADVFRDNALEVILRHRILPNIGSPGMIRELAKAGYAGSISMRVNPGFGHGHVNACDTGGPASKHGIWLDDAMRTAAAAQAAGMTVTMLHAHIGSGPEMDELTGNLERLAQEFAGLVPAFPALEAVSLGGGIPHNYRDPDADVPLEKLGAVLRRCAGMLRDAAGRNLRIEIEPGRYYVAPACVLVSRVTDVKQTRTNGKGDGATFAMVDAGFVDLVRPAMYGSWHRISVVGRDSAVTQPVVVAGPLCESGDVFTRDDAELLRPRDLPLPEPGDLLLLHDAGAYGFAMSSNYNSVGRAPQLWLEEEGGVSVMSRRETVEDLLRTETDEPLPPAAPAGETSAGAAPGPPVAEGALPR